MDTIETSAENTRATTTTNCECGKPYRVGDSFTLNGQGRQVKCVHWNLPEEIRP